MSLFSHLRVMDETDLDWVVQLEQLCYPLPWSRRGLKLSLHNGLGFVFCDRQDVPLGYCFVQTAADEVELLNFAVAPQYRRQGVGRDALISLLRRFDNVRFAQMFLEVRLSNQAAIRLYHQVGFNEIGVRSGYYRNPGGSREDALLMAYTLQAPISLPAEGAGSD
jgi:ribosomal-protein-alanine N-acetyltransferase